MLTCRCGWSFVYLAIQREPAGACMCACVCCLIKQSQLAPRPVIISMPRAVKRGFAFDVSQHTLLLCILLTNINVCFQFKFQTKYNISNESITFLLSQSCFHWIVTSWTLTQKPIWECVRDKTVFSIHPQQEIRLLCQISFHYGIWKRFQSEFWRIILLQGWFRAICKRKQARSQDL